MRNEARNSRIIFWLGIVGLIFYVVAPILFPDAPVRQPELLPVYSAMIGIGHLLKPKEENSGS